MRRSISPCAGWPRWTAPMGTSQLRLRSPSLREARSSLTRHRVSGLVRPGADKDGPTDGRIRLDGVSGKLYPLFKEALGYGQPITLTFRQYRVLPGHIDDVTGPDEEIAGLQLQNVSVSGSMAEGTVAWPDGRKFNVPTGPDAFFDRGNYPALFS